MVILGELFCEQGQWSFTMESVEGVPFLQHVLSLTERVFNEFVKEHKGKSFGPLAPDIKNALTESRAWEDRHRMMDEKGLDSKLRQWRNEANSFFGVSLSGLSSADKEYLRDLIQPRVDELVRSLEQAEEIPEKFHKDFNRRNAEDSLR